MNTEVDAAPEEVKEKDHRLMIFIGGSIIIAILLVMVAMALYVSSGTEQLDLSRPGLAKLRNQVHTKDTTFQGFPSSGPLDDKAYSDFSILYDQKLQEVNSVDAFSGDVLNPQALQIGPAPQQ